MNNRIEFVCFGGLNYTLNCIWVIQWSSVNLTVFPGQLNQY